MLQYIFRRANSYEIDYRFINIKNGYFYIYFIKIPAFFYSFKPLQDWESLYPKDQEVLGTQYYCPEEF